MTLMTTGWKRAWIAACAMACLGGCDKAKEPGGSSPRAPAPRPSAVAEALERTPQPPKLVAIGDVHGDLRRTEAVLRLAGVLDPQGRWSGGRMVVVQVGDEIDRGEEDRQVLDLFDRLREEAMAAGGKVVPLIGNHEAMNVQLQFDYVAPRALEAFQGIEGLRREDPRIASVPEAARARAAAFVPGGPYASKLAKRAAIAIVGDTLFVHGGVEPGHVRYGLARINRELSRWMNGEAPAPSNKVLGEAGPLWNRRYSASPDAQDCLVLDQVLHQVQVRRMVVGHTVQRGGISQACEGKVWRIDVGLSSHYGGPLEALVIQGDSVQTLRGSEEPAAR